MRDVICLDAGSRWQHDPPYHPNDSSAVFITDSLIAEISEAVLQAHPRATAVLDYIREHERLHRLVVIGMTAESDAERSLRDITDAYCYRCGNWPHAEEAYDAFYRILNAGNWR